MPVSVCSSLRREGENASQADLERAGIRILQAEGHETKASIPNGRRHARRAKPSARVNKKDTWQVATLVDNKHGRGEDVPPAARSRKQRG